MGPSSLVEQMQRSRSFEHGQERTRRPQQNKGTMYECETCRNRYRKLENFETHKKFYCSELHGPKNKPLAVKEPEEDVFHVNTHQHIPSGTGALDQQTSIRKRRKMKSVGDEDDQSPTDTTPPCLVGFETTTALANKTFSQPGLIADIQPNIQSKSPQIQLVARGMNTAESRLSPIQEMNISGAAKGELQRQGSGTSVIRHTNSLSRPNSFETESLDRVSPSEVVEKDQMKSPHKDRSSGVSTDAYQEQAFQLQVMSTGNMGGSIAVIVPVVQAPPQSISLVLCAKATSWFLRSWSQRTLIESMSLMLVSQQTSQQISSTGPREARVCPSYQLRSSPLRRRESVWLKWTSHQASPVLSPASREASAGTAASLEAPASLPPLTERRRFGLRVHPEEKVKLQNLRVYQRPSTPSGCRE
ncbi:hypothetical protein OJAV_G00109560 [Oryzias javanicus]|uniref:CCHC HIVEP-type domain-containing protein n=1 Tax=Oryzias javanicus TaxID=123683 RepID=A0A437CUP6_ORYJA|nr:hypothetical protein OJAV_G00109560 [Oryzias javanicus]